LLKAVLSWAVIAKVLDKNPLCRFTTPKKNSPNRPVLTAEQFATVREQAAAMSNTAELFVCLLWFTGRRAASVRQLRWDDVDLAGASVRWRADVDKIGYEHRNPLDAEFVPLLTRARAAQS
jgi:integrase